MKGGIKPNHKIPKQKVDGFIDGFECAQKIYLKKIKDLETKREYWEKRFKELEDRTDN